VGTITAAMLQRSLFISLGSRSTVKTSLRLDWKAIGIGLEEARFNQTVHEIQRLQISSCKLYVENVAVAPASLGG
jgi:hypothetical protein